MCVWTKKRGSMNAVVLMATPCPKSLHGKGEKWIARNILQGLDSVTVTSRLTDKKTKKYKRECIWTFGGGSKIRSQGERLKYLGARLGTADCLFQKPARPG